MILKVILKKDLKNIGQAGDIVSVKKGHARNLLLAKKWVIPFTKGSADLARHRQQWIEAKKKKALVDRQSLAEKIKGMEFSFVRKTSTKGHLFGSLTALDIAKELNAKGYEVDKKIVQLKNPLKETGQYKVLLDFGSDMQVEITIHITSPDRSTQSPNP